MHETEVDVGLRMNIRYTTTIKYCYRAKLLNNMGCLIKEEDIFEGKTLKLLRFNERQKDSQERTGERELTGNVIEVLQSV